jgi:hypothetical protein
MRYQSRTLAVLFFSLALLAGCATTGSPPSQSAGHWVATWGASPVATVASGQAFNNQTLRLIAHPSIGGNQVRVRIANTFGSQALQIGAAAIALQESEATVVASSHRVLTFSGHESISIPPGALVVSDPVTFTVPAQRNVAVSLFFPKDTGPATAHPGANQLSYVSSASVSTAGNFVVSNDATQFTPTVQSWPFLAGVEVRAENSARAIVTFGDSITDGFKSTVGANHRWPDYLTVRLRAANRDLAVVNQGISGNRILHDSAAAQPRFGPNALSRFDRDVLSVSGASHAVSYTHLTLPTM